MKKRLICYDVEGRRRKCEAEELFWHHVNKDGPDSPLGPCWEWTGYIRCQGGYGQLFTWEGGRVKPHRAHVYSYRLHYGPVPSGLQVSHLCHNPRCVNPGHLKAMTQKEDAADRKALGRANGRTRAKGLSEETVRAIKYGPGSICEKVERFGITAMMVSAIKSGKYHAHI